MTLVGREGEDLGSKSVSVCSMTFLHHNFLIYKIGEPWFLFLVSSQSNEKEL